MANAYGISRRSVHTEFLPGSYTLQTIIPVEFRLRGYRRRRMLRRWLNRFLGPTGRQTLAQVYPTAI